MSDLAPALVPAHAAIGSEELLLLTTDEVAKHERVTRSTIWKRVHAGDHPKPIRIGHCARFIKSEIDQYLASLIAARETAPAPSPTKPEARHG